MIRLQRHASEAQRAAGSLFFGEQRWERCMHTMTSVANVEATQKPVFALRGTTFWRRGDIVYLLGCKGTPVRLVGAKRSTEAGIPSGD